MKKEKNLYNRYARKYPTLLALGPFVAAGYFAAVSIPIESSTWSTLLRVMFPIFSGTAGFYLLSQIIRSVAIGVFENSYFSSGLRMPSSIMMSDESHEFSADYKTKIKSKIRNDFGIDLGNLSLSSTDDLTRLRESIELVRARVKDGHLLLQHNWEYGFVRNFCGGSLVAVVLSLINVTIFGLILSIPGALLTNMIILGIYLIPVLVSRFAMYSYGRGYARVLFREYLTS